MAVTKPWLQESQKAAQSLVTPQPNYLSARPGFYLGYLRGRSLPLKKYCYHYSIFKLLKVTISEKSSRRDEVSAHEISIPCLRTLYDKGHGSRVLQVSSLSLFILFTY